MKEAPARTNRAAGLKNRRIVRHGLRSAIGPVVAAFSLDLWLIMGGVIVAEVAFNLPGIGQYAIRALLTNDLPVIMGVTAALSLGVAGAKLILDVIHARLDPRITYA
jgi:peptide/nickel transport system permease protein